jgi:FkbM family methyltransferase
MIIKIYRTLRAIFDGTGISRIYPLNKIHRWFVAAFKQDTVEINGFKMDLDENDSLRLSVKGVYEETQTQFFKNNIKPGNLVFDIGANIGYYTLLFADLSKTGTIYAFEPDPSIAKIFKKNIAQNAISNVAFHQNAVGNKNETLDLFLNEDNRGDNRIYAEGQDWKSQKVECIRLDDKFQNLAIDFIKIDIQGSEFGAIEGMANLIANSPNLSIVTEFWPMGMKMFGRDAYDYMQFFISRGFEMYEFEQFKKSIIKISPEDVLKKLPVDKDVFTDLLFTRNKNIKLNF